MGQKAADVRESLIAGSWYPGQAETLRQTIVDFLAAVEPQPLEGQLMGLIAPHAGYIYSGQVAACAYRQLQAAEETARSLDLVVVISPLHRRPLGEYVTSQAACYRTPLGLVPLDAPAVDELEAAVGLQRTAFDNEHSLEIQLPFLQVVLAEFKLLPVMMGSQSLHSCQRLAAALAEILRGRSALLVASTDLSHFYTYDHAVRLDRQTLTYIDAFDPEGLAQALHNGKAEACGGGPVVATMLAARALGANEARILDYANSGDVTGDHSSVVGYAAGAIYRGKISFQKVGASSAI